MIFKNQFDISETMSSQPKGENLLNELIYSLLVGFLVSLEMTGRISTLLYFNLLLKFMLPDLLEQTIFLKRKSNSLYRC